MLTHLHIRDFAIIDAVELELGRGLCVLTGETGAGKSILVDALQLAVGARAGERLLALISGEGRNDTAPVLVAGPVYWRGSVNEWRQPNLVTFKTLREDKG